MGAKKVSYMAIFLSLHTDNAVTKKTQIYFLEKQTHTKTFFSDYNVQVAIALPCLAPHDANICSHPLENNSMNTAMITVPLLTS